MAGHSKWANIQHRKGKQDAIRSKMFSKLSKEITVAAKMGDPDPDKNPRLRLAVKAAKAVSMPKDVIDRAIQIHGGAGVSNDFPLAYWYAMQRTLRLADGPDEVHRAAIGKFEIGKYVSKDMMKASR